MLTYILAFTFITSLVLAMAWTTRLPPDAPKRHPIVVKRLREWQRRWREAEKALERRR